jgi:hypothetical protein
MVVTGVVLMAVGIFILWPLGSSGVDKRYVGRWVDKDGLVTHLNADGHFFTTDADGETDDWGQRWWVSGTKIVIYNPSPSQLVNVNNWLRYFVRRVTRQPQWNPFEDCEITRFDGQTLQLDGGLDLDRVPELPAAQ